MLIQMEILSLEILKHQVRYNSLNYILFLIFLIFFLNSLATYFMSVAVVPIVIMALGLIAIIIFQLVLLSRCLFTCSKCAPNEKDIDNRVCFCYSYLYLLTDLLFTCLEIWWYQSTMGSCCRKEAQIPIWLLRFLPCYLVRC